VHSFTAVVFAPPDVDVEYLRVLERLRADGFALLREFDGRARLSTFLRLKLGDLFAARILKLFGEDPARAWAAFERFFRDDVMRIILRRFPSATGQGPGGGQGREDLYQDVCFLLVEQDYRRIRSFDHRGSFAGYVRRVVRNLCTDLARRAEGRRRVPERILELGALEQDVYRILYWSDAGEAGLREALKEAGGGPHDPDAVDRAITRVHEAAARLEGGPRRAPTSLAWEEGGTGLHEEDLRDERPTPEARLLGAEEERRREGLLAAVAAAVERLPSECQLYVRMRFYEAPPKAPREIARLIGRTEAEVYRLRDRTIAALRARLADARSGLFPAVRLEG
jgi:RNA polymerase primary sigma factor